MKSHGIAEWYGEPIAAMSPARRQFLALVALGQEKQLPCPFRPGNPRCSKVGGVCSIQAKDSAPVITCPGRFEADNLIPSWLANIVGLDDVHIAREVPFMRSPATGRAAGRIDLVVARGDSAEEWFGLEIQAVYFSGGKMESDFERLLSDDSIDVPEPTRFRRPDWRSSSAKRLMPQLQIKAPTLRRWGTKLAVAVDMPFFDAMGGPSANYSQDLDDGDIVWLVSRINADYRLEAHHWEVLTLDDSSDKLLSAETVKRTEFEHTLREKLKPIGEQKQ